MTTAIPARIAFAVAQLKLRRSDAVLEIGCGNGAAAAELLPRLDSGTLLALDRSATAVAAARKRLAPFIRSGHARVERAALASFAAAAGAQLDHALAINVNVFWQSAGAELEAVRKLLRPRARLTLVFDPPSPAQLAKIGDSSAKQLREAGFQRVALRRERLSTTELVCVQALTPA